MVESHCCYKKNQELHLQTIQLYGVHKTRNVQCETIGLQGWKFQGWTYNIQVRLKVLRSIILNNFIMSIFSLQEIHEYIARTL